MSFFAVWFSVARQSQSELIRTRPVYLSPPEAVLHEEPHSRNKCRSDAVGICIVLYIVQGYHVSKNAYKNDNFFT
jgi:hypothetical protein